MLVTMENQMNVTIEPESQNQKANKILKAAIIFYSMLHLNFNKNRNIENIIQIKK